MERIRLILSCLAVMALLYSCGQEAARTVEAEATTTAQEIPEAETESYAAMSARLKSEGYEIWDIVDEASGDTVIMQQYYIAFLKRGPSRSQSDAEADSLQMLHMEHLSKMYELGYADISGPFGDDGDIRGITIYNVPTLAMADSLANSDPMVKAGRLQIEVHPWWAAKGFPLR